MNDTEPSRANRPASFDAAAARSRCVAHRRRILDVSQKLSALHIAPALSCLEMVDCIYYGLLRRNPDGSMYDTFIMSKGHGCVAQYAVLERLGIMPAGEFDRFCTPNGKYGAHPDYGLPGIEASTGSLGHGLSLATGMAHADRLLKRDRQVHVVLSDGELQEGSTWEAMMMAANLDLANLVAYIDHNGFQSLGRTRESHPHFYPIAEKAQSFGWEVAELNGHDASAVHAAVMNHSGSAPFMVIGNTIKGRGVSFMENEPIWHYRSPNPDEYKKAIAGLHEVSS
jgi:transketolase